MITFIKQLMSKPSTERMLGAWIVIPGHSVYPSHYEAIAALVKKTGLTGNLHISKDGDVELEVEGPYSKIDSLVKDLQRGKIAGVEAFREMLWRPYKKQFSSFVCCPYAAYRVFKLGDFRA
jgi:acylphosphatase